MVCPDRMYRVFWETQVIDAISPAERLNPPSLFRRWCTNFFLEIWCRYDLKCARWEYEQAKEGKAWLLAAKWMGQVENLEELLKRLGVDPRTEPEDLTKSFEVWLMAAAVVLTFLAVVAFNLYRSSLLELLK